MRGLNSHAVRAIERKGTPVMMRTIKCGLWKEVHEDCKGCPHELGCAKYALLTRTKMPQMLVNKILEAKTLDELREYTPPF